MNGGPPVSLGGMQHIVGQLTNTILFQQTLVVEQNVFRDHAAGNAAGSVAQRLVDGCDKQTAFVFEIADPQRPDFAASLRINA